MPRDLSPAVEDQFVELLAHIYGAVRWRKMSTSKNPWDIWNHRVRAAATSATLGEYVSRLCNHFGLQSLPLAAIALVEELRPHEAALLDLAHREHIPIAMGAVTRARAVKQARFGSGQGEGEEDAE